MGFISNKVEEEDNKVEKSDGLMPAVISREHVEEAITVLRTLSLKRARDFFYYLSAINLLNAAIKQSEYKKELGYGFIKGKALLVAKIIITRYRYDDIRYFYSIDEKCLYIDVYGVVFSFHNILEDPIIINTAAKAQTIVWPGIRLQRIAEPLYNLAKSLYYQEKIK